MKELELLLDSFRMDSPVKSKAKGTLPSVALGKKSSSTYWDFVFF